MIQHLDFDRAFARSLSLWYGSLEPRVLEDIIPTIEITPEQFKAWQDGEDIVIASPPPPPAVIKHFIVTNRLSGAVNLIEVVDGTVERYQRIRRRTYIPESLRRLAEPSDKAPLNKWSIRNDLAQHIWQEAYERRGHGQSKVVWTEVPVS